MAQDKQLQKKVKKQLVIKRLTLCVTTV